MYKYQYAICVATVNGPQRLENFIRSVKEHTFNFDYSICIADDCSDVSLSSKNYDLAVKYKCFYVRNTTRSGVPYSWNRATELSDSEYVVISNDDVLVVPGWLEAYDTFIKANFNLKLGVCAWPATGKLGDQSKHRSFKVGPDQSHIATPIVACSGYLFACSRRLLQDVGHFDERYFATWEEIDFGAKLCMNGYQSIGLSSPTIYHQGGASFSDPINQHPNIKKQSLCQTQWIDKWAHILNITRENKSPLTLISEISVALIDKTPKYKDFNHVDIDLSTWKSSGKIIPREDIEGWFDYHELYRRMILEAPDNAKFVEVGAWMGKSSCFMAEMIKFSGKNIKFDCVDLWDLLPYDVAYDTQKKIAKEENTTLKQRFINNLAKYNVSVNLVQAISWEAASLYEDGSLDFIFIDAGHDFDSVTKDLNAWYPKLKSTGKMAGHDYFYTGGVGRAVREFFEKKRIPIKVIGECWSVKI